MGVWGLGFRGLGMPRYADMGDMTPYLGKGISHWQISLMTTLNMRSP